MCEGVLCVSVCKLQCVVQQQGWLPVVACRGQVGTDTCVVAAAEVLWTVRSVLFTYGRISLRRYACHLCRSRGS